MLEAHFGKRCFAASLWKCHWLLFIESTHCVAFYQDYAVRISRWLNAITFGTLSKSIDLFGNGNFFHHLTGHLSSSSSFFRWMGCHSVFFHLPDVHSFSCDEIDCSTAFKCHCDEFLNQQEIQGWHLKFKTFSAESPCHPEPKRISRCLPNTSHSSIKPDSIDHLMFSFDFHCQWQPTRRFQCDNSSG